MTPVVRAGLTALVALAGLAACSRGSAAPAAVGSAPTTPPTFAPVTTAPPADDVPAGVDMHVIAPEGPRDGYDRSLFEHWIDDDGDGCRTRCEVLERERRTHLPGLPGGGWLSAYDGYSTPDPAELEVDHVVALAEAWDSGAATWDADRRRAFANDLDALTAVTAATNRSKGDRDPADWQPPARDAWCGYAAQWIEVKVRWSLTADEAEVGALRNLLAGCDPA